MASGTEVVADYKTGLENFSLNQVNNSGVTGGVIIDWDVFGQGNTYNVTSWRMGRVFAPVTRNGDLVSSGGGNGIPQFTWIQAGATIDGSLPLYPFLVPDDPEISNIITLDVANYKGPITILNMNINLQIQTNDESVVINGNASITLPGSSLITLALINVSEPGSQSANSMFIQTSYSLFLQPS